MTTEFVAPDLAGLPEPPQSTEPESAGAHESVPTETGVPEFVPEERPGMTEAEVSAWTALGGETPEHYRPYASALAPAVSGLVAAGYEQGALLKMIERAHARGVDPNILGGLAQDLASVAREGAPTPEQMTQARDDREAEARDLAVAALRTDYGDAFEERLGEARRFGSRIFGDQFSELSNIVLDDGSLLGDSPQLIRSLIAAAGRAASLQAVRGAGEGMTIVSDSDTAKRQIKRFEYENREALYDATHPLHDDVIAQRDALYQLAHGDEPLAFQGASSRGRPDQAPLPESIRLETKSGPVVVSQKIITQWEQKHWRAIANQSDPNHDWAVRERSRMYELLYGNA